MIKITRVDNERTKAAKEILANEKLKKSGTYNKPEINQAVKEIFHGKCYICENKDITSCQIEHLKPHEGDTDLKFEWNNLFWACAHCNNTKSNKYTQILNCNEVEVDKKISFRKEGYFGKDEKYYFEAVNERSEEIDNTIALLNAVYYGNTYQKELESINIRRKLRKNIAEFKEIVREYDEEKDCELKKDLALKIKYELCEKSEFTAFKRWIIWDNSDRYPEFKDF